MSRNKFPEVDSSWTLFLDRDGVINRKLEDAYVETWDQFEFLPGVLEALYTLKDTFYKIIIVTNQAGIGKGLMTHDDLAHIHTMMLEGIQNAQGRIDEIYYSPDPGYLKSYTRKPAPGLAIKARSEFRYIDFTKSIIVGDSPSDITFGKNLGMYMVGIGNIEFGDRCDYVVPDLLTFARLLTNTQN